MAPPTTEASASTGKSTMSTRLYAAWPDLLICLMLAVLTYLVRSLNLMDFPGINIDEGFYVSQAWSVLTHGELSPHGYRADHPPGGWLQLAGLFLLTGQLGYDGELLALAGRNLMVLYAIVSVVLLYALARRLELSRAYSALASVLWILSPLANSYGRMTLLDNIAIPFVLAAFVLVLDPKRRFAMAYAGAVSFGVAFWSKEIVLLVLPGLVLALWQHFHGLPLAKRLYVRWALVAMAGILSFPGWLALTGRFNLFWEGQVEYQLQGRESSGSVFDTSSTAHQVFYEQWMSIDAWLLTAGMLAMLLALFVRNLHGPLLVMATHVLVLLMPSRFLPVPFVIIMLPFAALLVAGVLAGAAYAVRMLAGRMSARQAAWLSVLPAVVVMTIFVIGGGAREWNDTWKYQASAQENIYQRQAVDWAHANLGPSDVVVTEYHLWLDIVATGAPEDDVANPYMFGNEPDKRWPERVTYLLLSTYSMPDRVDDPSILTDLAARSEVVLRLGEDGDYRQMFVLRAPAPTG